VNNSDTPQGLFIRVLEVEQKWAEILVTNGLQTIEEVAYIPIEEFRLVDGLCEQRIQDWRVRARHHLLVDAIGDGGDDEEGPLATATAEPPKPTSGGSGATLYDNDDRR
jgi:transcription termination/antitermination protein NusA